MLAFSYERINQAITCRINNYLKFRSFGYELYFTAILCICRYNVGDKYEIYISDSGYPCCFYTRRYLKVFVMLSHSERNDLNKHTKYYVVTTDTTFDCFPFWPSTPSPSSSLFVMKFNTAETRRKYNSF